MHFHGQYIIFYIFQLSLRKRVHLLCKCLNLFVLNENALQFESRLVFSISVKRSGIYSDIV